jgi:hypothetical protein
VPNSIGMSNSFAIRSRLKALGYVQSKGRSLMPYYVPRLRRVVRTFSKGLTGLYPLIPACQVHGTVLALVDYLSPVSRLAV